MPHPFAVGVDLADAHALLERADAAALLDDARIAYAVLGAERSGLRSTAGSISPTVAATALARRTSGVGIVVAASPQRDHPYNIARRLGSLDHVSAGRAGLLALGQDAALELGLDRRSSWVDGELDAAVLADAITAIRRLWRSWPIESLDADPAVADAIDIHYAEHEGLFRSRGPLNVPTTPQGEPLVFSAPTRLDEVEPAARGTDVLVIEQERFAAFEHALRLAKDEAQHDGRALGVHVRTVIDGLGDRARHWRKHPIIDGLVIESATAELPALVGEVLPALADDGLIESARAGSVLRDALRIAQRPGPDLSSAPIAFPARTRVG